ncbi:MAG: sigma-70 family RNA polymerase sigma factor [Pseudomonadota bacterium]|nr:sigma-70 family RNA polymerase sigma factor [Pseudomonadota bacterium]
MHAPEPDSAALRRLDPGAIEEVFDAFGARLNGFLRRMGASPEVAEELVQETFVRLVRHAPRLKEDTRIGAWLFTVARNLWVSHRRWAWVDGTRLLELAGAPRRGPPTPAEDHDASESRARLERAVAALPEAQREVFLLVAGEDLDPIEAAAILGITPEAARQRLARARRALEEQLS